jgi:hypothetical protein
LIKSLPIVFRQAIRRRGIKMIASFHDKIQEVERLADELNELLAGHCQVLGHSSACDQARELAQWAEWYRQGLHHGVLEAGNAYGNGNAWLAGVFDRLQLEAEELNSLEDRGSSKAGEDSAAQPETENFIETAHQVSHAVSVYVNNEGGCHVANTR